MSNRDDLSKVSQERVALPDGFQIHPDVLLAAGWFRAEAPLEEATYKVCPLCKQGIYLVADWRGGVEYTTEQADSLILDHLMKRHGWTRESIGES